MIDSSDGDPEHTVCSESDGTCSDESDCTNTEFVHYVDKKETADNVQLNGGTLFSS